jgi:4-hydroxy-3-methylbut-2-enyl diphosphate reductase
VDRAVDYAYQTRERFPDRRVFLTGEIIHNPHVNEKLRAMGIEFMGHDDASVNAIGPDDVVILPAFGVTVAMLERLDRRGCTLIDTTCGSVLNVWKNVRRYAEGGYTSVIHGRSGTRRRGHRLAAVMYGGRYLVVFDRDEASRICDLIRRRDRWTTPPGPRSSSASAARCRVRTRPRFERIGLANQTTMLMSESLEIGEMLRAAMLERHGADHLGAHFQAFDTICSATRTCRTPSSRCWGGRSMMIVIGGYNSSNTCNLARICRVAADLPHRRPRLPRVGRGNPAPPRRRQGRGIYDALAAVCGSGDDWPHVRGLHPGQPDGGRRRQACRVCRAGCLTDRPQAPNGAKQR